MAAFSQRWRIFSLCSLLFILSQFYRTSSAVIAPDLEREFSLSSTQLGMLGAAFFYAFALSQIPIGLLLDRKGPRLTMTVLSLIAAVGSCIFATAADYGTALLGRVMLGVGMAGNLMGPMALIGRWFERDRFATLSGVLLAMGTLGNTLSTSPLAYAAKTVGWRLTFLVLGVLTFSLSVLFYRIVRDRPGCGSVDGGYPPDFFSVRSTLSLLVVNRNYWLISAGTFLRYGTFAAIQSLWAGPYLIKQHGLSPVAAGNILLLLNVGLIMGSPLGGWLSEAVVKSSKKTVLLGLAGLSFFQFTLGLYDSPGKFSVLGVLFWGTGFFGAFGIIMYAHIKELMPDRITGTALTGINLFTMLGAAVFIHGLGSLLDRVSSEWGYSGAFVVCGLSAFVGMVLYLFTSEGIGGKDNSRQNC
ncbi:MFS transporter [Thermodesulforhabdus norvegica]|uniref:Sugar phosphate permease n=1 Tax=Thermodesulforhabdus norvegica TaxID=39841 RepID=A0A1I4R3L0_9BACT|nr:MFS transporter [Thermodesulforhabdus norvegica]SFM46892.1 Sugar phosphate permease [Thermodesulforhabdus norvegica]